MISSLVHIKGLIFPLVLPLSFSSVIISISCLMVNQKWALLDSLRCCVCSLWVCLLPFKTRTLGAVCIDKTHEYLNRAIYHLTPLAPPLTPKQYSLHFSFCVSTPRSALHWCLPSTSTIGLHLLCVVRLISIQLYPLCLLTYSDSLSSLAFFL